MFTMKDIFTVTPHLPFRFKVEFFGTLENLKKVYSEATYFVKSVKLPVIESGSEDNTIFLGNGMITIPTFNPASRELEITFEETDIMGITSFLDSFTISNSCGWFRPIIIGITEYTQDMNTVLRRKAYHCKLKGYSEGEFSNSGGVNIITITVTFKVDSEIDWDGEEIKFEKDQLNRIEGLTKNIKDMKLQTMNITTVSAKSTYKEEAQMFQQSNSNYGVNYSGNSMQYYTPPGNPVGSVTLLDGILSPSSKSDYHAFIKELQAKDPSFNPNTSAFIYYDIGTNTKYVIENGVIIRRYAAFVAKGNASQKSGEAPEGAYKLKPAGTYQKGTHYQARNKVLQALASVGISEEQIRHEVASGKYKTTIDALRGHGINFSGTEKEAEFLNYSDYTSNLIDEGNGDSGRELASSAIHNHIDSNWRQWVEYNLKVKNGTNTAEDDRRARQQLSHSTAGCTAMAPEDLAWEKEWILKHGGEVYEIKGNGITEYNQRNNKKRGQ